MNLPADLDNIITLYLYDELSVSEKQEFEAHVAFNEQSRKRLEEMRSLHDLIGQKVVAEPTEALLEKSRVALRERLRAERSKRPTPSWFASLIDRFYFRPGFTQVVGATAFLLVGVLLGSMFRPAIDDHPGSIVPAVADNPESMISNIERVEYEPGTGQVTVHYQTVQDLAVRGDVQNEAIRRLLTHTIRRESHPGRRLTAVRAAQWQRFTDSDLESALLYAMQNDEVDGVRLRAAKALQQLPINENIKLAFVQVLLKDPNSAMRIVAVEALGGSQQEDVMSVFQNALRGDENEFVRLKAAKVLERREFEDDNQ